MKCCCCISFHRQGMCLVFTSLSQLLFTWMQRQLHSFMNNNSCSSSSELNMFEGVIFLCYNLAFHSKVSQRLKFRTWGRPASFPHWCHDVLVFIISKAGHAVCLMRQLDAKQKFPSLSFPSTHRQDVCWSVIYTPHRFIIHFNIVIKGGLSVNNKTVKFYQRSGRGLNPLWWKLKKQIMKPVCMNMNNTKLPVCH